MKILWLVFAQFRLGDLKAQRLMIYVSCAPLLLVQVLVASLKRKPAILVSYRSSQLESFCDVVLANHASHLLKHADFLDMIQSHGPDIQIRQHGAHKIKT